ncbi:MAG: hypothetical protein N3G19_00915 [Candidatus Pacearchaeota archaeon]|nr:hypothetical protein [Candidatus Pacearchaeota archaeon]
MKKIKFININDINVSNIFIVLFIILLLIFVSGQEGCETSRSSEKQQAEKAGIDFNLITGVDYLSSGKILEQGENFYVGVHLENYDSKAKSGEICIYDDVSDEYGGIISDGECKPFVINAATIIKKETTELASKKIVEEIIPGKADVYFPEEGLYKYYGLPSQKTPWQMTLFVSVRYRENSRITGSVKVPDPGYEQLSLLQEPAPLFVSATKSIHKQQDSYKVNLDVSLIKKAPFKIFSPDFKQENVTAFYLKLEPQPTQCFLTTGEPIKEKVFIENERLIKCSSLVHMAGELQRTLPLIIALDYGVAIEKSYSFGIKTM